jgi:3-mercaptopyruvate sulfurtransferase SseA
VIKVEKNILDAINSVTQVLDSLDEYFLHPEEISKMMHEKGINMRYLYLVYDHSTLNFTKAYIIS